MNALELLDFELRTLRYQLIVLTKSSTTITKNQTSQEKESFPMNFDFVFICHNLLIKLGVQEIQKLSKFRDIS